MGSDAPRLGTYVFELDGRGGGREIPLDEAVGPSSGEAFLWVHLAMDDPAAQAWLQGPADLESRVADALLAEETRPRVAAEGDGLLVILRGVNTNPGANPEDMVSIRIWLEERRILTVRKRRLEAISDLRTRIVSGQGPGRPSTLLMQLSDLLTQRMRPVMTSLEDAIDELEEATLSDGSSDLPGRLADLRRTVIGLRRYLAPQREALARLHQEGVPLLNEDERLELREVASGVQRIVESLDAARERASILNEEVGHILTEETNRTVYLLSIVTAVFLPLGLLTGLLGINVGGIPGADSPWGFLTVVALLLGIGGLQLWWLRLKGLL